MSALPPVLCGRDLPLPELAAARLDGDVFMLGDEHYVCVDECDRPFLRARSLAGVLPSAAIVEGTTALWVYGTRSRPPARHTICIDATHRARVDPDIRWTVRERLLGDGDVTRLAGIRLVTPLCLACDLLRAASFTSQEQGAVARILHLAHLDRAAVRDRLQRSGPLPGVRRALRRLSGEAF
jgi:hypothetical protein